MRTFGMNSPLYMAVGDGLGGGVTEERITALANDAINKAIATWTKRELPQVFENSMQTFAPQLVDQFLERLQEQLPSDEELAEIEQEALSGDGGEEVDEGQYEEEDGEDQGQGQGQGQQYDMRGLPPAIRAQLMHMERRNQEMEAKLAELDEQRQAAIQQVEEQELYNEIQAQLNQYTFANETSRDLAMNYFLSHVDRMEDGSLVAGELPLKDFVETNMGNLPGLLQARNVGGSGASASMTRGMQTPQMEQIRPGMPADERKAIMQHAVSLLPVAGS
jgi:hypothetical protein